MCLICARSSGSISSNSRCRNRYSYIKTNWRSTSFWFTNCVRLIGISGHTFMLLSELHWLPNGSFYFTPLLKKRLACVASVSAWVRRESWEESKKRNDGGGGGERRNHLFYRFRSNFRAITRLETLATQAKKRWTVKKLWKVQLQLTSLLQTKQAP